MAQLVFCQMENISKKNLESVSRASAIFSGLACLAMTLTACGPSFGPELFTESNYAGNGNTPQTAGSAGQLVSASAGQAGKSEGSGGMGIAGSNSESSGGTSSGGNPATAGNSSAGRAGGPQGCLKNFETADCAVACTHAPQSEIACVQLLQCMREKNVGPAQGSLDPCYGMGYQDLQLAIQAYKSCCN